MSFPAQVASAEDNEWRGGRQGREEVSIQISKESSSGGERLRQKAKTSGQMAGRYEELSVF